MPFNDSPLQSHQFRLCALFPSVPLAVFVTHQHTRALESFRKRPSQKVRAQWKFSFQLTSAESHRALDVSSRPPWVGLRVAERTDISGTSICSCLDCTPEQSENYQASSLSLLVDGRNLLQALIFGRAIDPLSTRKSIAPVSSGLSELIDVHCAGFVETGRNAQVKLADLRNLFYCLLRVACMLPVCRLCRPCLSTMTCYSESTLGSAR